MSSERERQTIPASVQRIWLRMKVFGQPPWEEGGGDNEVPVTETESSVDEGKCSFDPEKNTFPCVSRS